VVRVGFIIRAHPRGDDGALVGGATKAPFRLLRALRERVEVSGVVVGEPPSGFDAHGYRVSGRPVAPLRLYARTLAWNAANAGAVRRLFRTSDVVQCHHPHLGLSAALVRHTTRRRVPFVVKAHGTATPELRANAYGGWRGAVLRVNAALHRAHDRVVLRAADVCVVSSDHQRREMTEIYGVRPDRLRRVYNGVDGQHLLAPGTGPAATGGPHAVFVGRVVPKKGLAHLLALHERIVERHPGARLTLVLGHRHAVEDRATLDLVEREAVRLPGVEVLFDLDEPTLFRTLRDADLGIVPSNGYESIPTVVLEMAAAGLPVFATYEWGIPEVLPVAFGLTGDVDHDAGRILDFVASGLPDWDRAAQAARYAGHRYDVLAEEYLRIYAEVGARRPEIVVVDLWTDANRGDDALQVGLVEMVRRHHPTARVTGIFRFGTNELADAAPEITDTSAALDRVLGGLRRTHYSAAHADGTGGARHLATSLASFVEAYACIAAFLVLRRGSRPLVGPARYRTLDALRRADLVVWKGKNFRAYPGLTSVSRTLTLCGAGHMAGLLARDLVCVNASFWPIEGALPRWLYRRAFARVRAVTVRDRSSAGHATALLGDDARVQWCADLSFPLVAARAGASGAAAGRWDVALTVTGWGSEVDRRRYVDALVAAGRALVGLGARRFVVVPQVTRRAEDASELVDEVVRRIGAEPGASVEVVEGAPSIDELLATYRGCRMLVGSRMHSCVFARAVGVPFVAVAYDEGPKWEILTELWPDDLVLGYGVAPDVLAAACARVWTSGDQLVEESRAAWDACVLGAEENIGGLGDLAR
jgi:colanic acid/amylovoran biosynthesis protein